MPEPIGPLLVEVRACRVCEAHLPLPQRPIVQLGRRANVVIIGQAPGQKVQDTGVPWNDPSGDHLREWLAVDRDAFYDATRFALIPMGFCYPGKRAGGDLPPRPECAPLWHERLLRQVHPKAVILLVGQYAQQHYLGAGTKPGMAANMEDVFNPDHTYKYAAPGPQLLNNAPGGNYQLWVPDDVPNCASTNGQYYSSQKDSPVRWVIWSMGPKPNSPESNDEHAPMARQSWYRRTGQGGVIARFQTRAGVQFQSQ